LEKKEMGLRIKSIIKEKGLTIEQAAKMMGFSREGLYKHITGNPSLKILNRIADTLEVDITELFEHPKVNEFTCPNCGTKLTVTKK
jgi:transcriptional regulator with XRE-family HTH domain